MAVIFGAMVQIEAQGFRDDLAYGLGMPYRNDPYLPIHVTVDFPNCPTPVVHDHFPHHYLWKRRVERVPYGKRGSHDGEWIITGNCIGWG